MLDVVKRYDVDGDSHRRLLLSVHRDADRRSPREEEAHPREGRDSRFPTTGRGRSTARRRASPIATSWRRANIDDFIRSLYRGVKAIKPTTLVGISPFGIWRSGTPEGVKGLDAYSEIYADSRKWLAEGWLDYMVPQLYWQVDGYQDRFRALDSWWRSENHAGTSRLAGAVHLARLRRTTTPGRSSEIRKQIVTLREDRVGERRCSGPRPLSVGRVVRQQRRPRAAISRRSYRERALVPASPWLAEPVAGSAARVGRQQRWAGVVQRDAR